MNQDIQLIRSPKAARMLGIVPGTLRAWRVIGKGPKYTKIGESVFYRREDIARYVEDREVASTSDETVKAQ